MSADPFRNDYGAPVRFIEFTAPVRIESEMNRREHWTKRHERFTVQARAVFLSWPRRAAEGLTPPLIVKLTRIAPRVLDSDNLTGGFKAVRDQIAACLDLDDGNRQVEWRYYQQRGKPHEYAIRIRIEPL